MASAVPQISPVVVDARKDWDRWKSNCSGYVHAVTHDLGIDLNGDANEMVDSMSRPGSGWISLGHDAHQAQAYANVGYVVVGGLKEPGHGHVVIIVPHRGPSRYPYAYWGQLGGVGREDATINWAWSHPALPHVEYFAHLPAKETQ